jgi:hypothetical protein
MRRALCAHELSNPSFLASIIALSQLNKLKNPAQSFSKLTVITKIVLNIFKMSHHVVNRHHSREDSGDNRGVRQIHLAFRQAVQTVIDEWTETGWRAIPLSVVTGNDRGRALRDPEPYVSEVITLTTDNAERVLRSLVGQREPANVRLLAMTGMGKSTLVPSLLSRLAGPGVYVIEPAMHLATQAHAYVLQKYSADAQLLTATTRVGSGGGITFTTAAIMLSMMLMDRRFCTTAIKVMYLDECHEATAEYYCLRVLMAENLRHVHRFYASATHGDSDLEKNHRLHAIEYMHFPYVPASSWISAADQSAPWFPSNIKKRTLVFLPEISEALTLKPWYERAAVPTEILSRQSDVTEYRRIYQFLHNRGSNRCVVLTDDVAETGLTMPIDVVIDLMRKKCSYYNPSLRRYEFRYRPTTRAETLQRAGRLGRLKSGRYYYCTRATDTHPLLFDNERHRAYLWLRVFGLHPLARFDDIIADFGLLTIIGAAQILNCRLPPMITRFYLDDQGCFYNNLESAIRFYMRNSDDVRYGAHRCDPRTSVNWNTTQFSHEALDDGRPVSVKIPSGEGCISSNQQVHLSYAAEHGFSEVAEDLYDDNLSPPYLPPVRSADTFVPSDSGPISPPATDAVATAVTDDNNEESLSTVSPLASSTFERASVAPSRVTTLPAYRSEATQPPSYHTNIENDPHAHVLHSLGRHSSVVSSGFSACYADDQRIPPEVVPRRRTTLSAVEPTRIIGSRTADYRQYLSLAYRDLSKLPPNAMIFPSDTGNTDYDFLSLSKSQKKDINRLLVGGFPLAKLSSEARAQLFVAFCCYWNFVVKQKIQYCTQLSIAENESQVSFIRGILPRILTLPALRSKKAYYCARFQSLIQVYTVFRLYGYSVKVHPDTFHTGPLPIVNRPYLHSDCSGRICGRHDYFTFSKVSRDPGGLRHIGYAITNGNIVICPAHMIRLNSMHFLFDGHNRRYEFSRFVLYNSFDVAIGRVVTPFPSPRICYHWAMPLAQPRHRMRVTVPVIDSYVTLDDLERNTYLAALPTQPGYSGLPVLSRNYEIVGFLAGGVPHRRNLAVVRPFAFLLSHYNIDVKEDDRFPLYYESKV